MPMIDSVKDLHVDYIRTLRTQKEDNRVSKMGKIFE